MIRTSALAIDDAKINFAGMFMALSIHPQRNTRDTLLFKKRSSAAESVRGAGGLALVEVTWMRDIHLCTA